MKDLVKKRQNGNGREGLNPHKRLLLSFVSFIPNIFINVYPSNDSLFTSKEKKKSDLTPPHFQNVNFGDRSI